MKIVSKDLLNQIRQDVPNLPSSITALHLSLEDEETGEFHVRAYPSIDEVRSRVEAMASKYDS